MTGKWRDVALLGLVGLGSSLVAVTATVVLAFGFSLMLAASVVFAMTGSADLDVLTIIIEYLFLPVAGALAGLAGGMAGLIVLKRIWNPSSGWRWGWALAWTLGGIVLWLGLWTQRTVLNFMALFIVGSLAWVLLAVGLVVVLLIIAPPWKQ